MKTTGLDFKINSQHEDISYITLVMRNCSQKTVEQKVNLDGLYTLIQSHKESQDLHLDDGAILRDDNAKGWVRYHWGFWLRAANNVSHISPDYSNELVMMRKELHKEFRVKLSMRRKTLLAEGRESSFTTIYQSFNVGECLSDCLERICGVTGGRFATLQYANKICEERKIGLVLSSRSKIIATNAYHKAGSESITCDVAIGHARIDQWAHEYHVRLNTVDKRYLSCVFGGYPSVVDFNRSWCCSELDCNGCDEKLCHICKHKHSWTTCNALTCEFCGKRGHVHMICAELHRK